MTSIMPREVVSTVVVDVQPKLRPELQRAHDVLDSFRRAGRDLDWQLERRNILTLIHNQLLEFALRIHPHFEASDALLTVLAHIDGQLTPCAARDVTEQLESLLIYTDDDMQLLGRLERERRFNDAQHHGPELVWSALFSAEEIDLLCRGFAAASDEGQRVAESLRHRARARLRSLHKARFSCRRERSADTEMRAAMMRRMTFALLALVAVMAELFRHVAWSANGEVIGVLTAIVAGGVGAALSSCHKLREESLGREEFQRYLYREVWGQAVFGLVAGLFVFVAVNSGFVSVAGLAGNANWYQAATIGFVCGFSEPFFMGLMKRISASTVVADKASVAPGNAPESLELRTLGQRRSNLRIAALS